MAGGVNAWCCKGSWSGNIAYWTANEHLIGGGGGNGLAFRIKILST